MDENKDCFLTSEAGFYFSLAGKFNRAAGDGIRGQYIHLQLPK